MNPRIYVLTLVTFAFGSGAFIFAGLLETLAADLHVTTAVAGQLQTVFVLTSAVLGPVAAWLFGRVDRKYMVIAGLSLGLVLRSTATGPRCVPDKIQTPPTRRRREHPLRAWSLQRGDGSTLSNRPGEARDRGPPRPSARFQCAR